MEDKIDKIENKIDKINEDIKKISDNIDNIHVVDIHDTQELLLWNIVLTIIVIVLTIIVIVGVCLTLEEIKIITDIIRAF